MPKSADFGTFGRYQMPFTAPTRVAGDLALLASGAADAKPSGDGSVVLLSADTEICAGEAVAARLASQGEEDRRHVTFVLGKETDLLDHSLARHGLPRLGVSAPSPHRALLQVPPLAYSLAWEPPDPNRLLDVLLLPTSPVPRSVSRDLAKVVAENPGIGGREWVDAWTHIAAEPPKGGDPKSMRPGWPTGGRSWNRSGTSRTRGSRDWRREPSPTGSGNGRPSGLEQEFNSLDAQREACEAYVRSQKHEGWLALPTLYDDPGYSGGNMERPALKRLLADIAARKIDVVVVHKVDRLTRALADFAKIVEIFDASTVSFVSITQAFNTTTSMGRLTLNVLLSFAQFEREVTGERIPSLPRPRLGPRTKSRTRRPGRRQQASRGRERRCLWRPGLLPRRALPDAAEPGLPRRDRPQGVSLSRRASGDCR